jgi:hypothetical protein
VEKVMIRDKVKDEKYFELYLQNIINRKKAYIEKINLLNDPNQGFINSSITLDLFSRNILIAKYSAGEDIEKLLPDYEETIKWLILAYTSTAYYVQLLWTISIGIMIDKEKRYFGKIIDIIKNDDPNDCLIDFLLSNCCQWNKKSSGVKFPNPYSSLIEVIKIAETDKQKAVERLKIYLEKEWYNGHSDSGWYNNHKNKHDTYYGYWSFESGALVKILNLDDVILKDINYYPYDMVHG